MITWRKIATARAARIGGRQRNMSPDTAFWRAVAQAMEAWPHDYCPEDVPENKPFQKLTPNQIRALQKNLNGLSVRDQSLIYNVPQSYIRHLRALHRAKLRDLPPLRLPLRPTPIAPSAFDLLKSNPFPFNP